MNALEFIKTKYPEFAETISGEDYIDLNGFAEIAEEYSKYKLEAIDYGSNILIDSRISELIEEYFGITEPEDIRKVRERYRQEKMDLIKLESYFKTIKMCDPVFVSNFKKGTTVSNRLRFVLDATNKNKLSKFYLKNAKHLSTSDKITLKVREHLKH